MSDDYRYSLLPGNASPFERAVEQAFRELVSDIAPPFPALYQANNTPAEFLPHLGADRGVTAWQTTAADDVKRASVANAWTIKRLAGTREALTRALSLAQFSARFVPWHETGAVPYTLEIVATSDANQTPDDYQRLDQRMLEAKAERDEITIRVEKTVPIEQRLRIGQATQQATSMRVSPVPLTIGLPGAPLIVTAALQTARRWTLQPTMDVETPPISQLFAGVIRAATLMTVGAPANG